MALDDYSYDIDSSDGGVNSSEKATEALSEKFKEAVKKASAGIVRTQKDEKKAKKFDFLLANFLAKIIVDKKYDSILENVFKTMNFGYSSNFVLGILSLLDLEISNKIREISGKEKIFFDFKLEERGEFDDNNIRPQNQKRINQWIEDMKDLLTIEYSHIQNKKNIELLENDRKVIVIFTAQIFSFFMNEINISVKKDKSIDISNYIIFEIKKSLRNIKIDEI